MIKLLEGIENLGEEVQCKECGSIVHCEEEDWKEEIYWFHNEKRRNESICCPKCFCTIFRWTDRYVKYLL